MALGLDPDFEIQQAVEEGHRILRLMGMEPDTAPTAATAAAGGGGGEGGNDERADGETAAAAAAAGGTGSVGRGGSKGKKKQKQKKQQQQPPAAGIADMVGWRQQQKKQRMQQQQGLRRGQQRGDQQQQDGGLAGGGGGSGENDAGSRGTVENKGGWGLDWDVGWEEKGGQGGGEEPSDGPTQSRREQQEGSEAKRDAEERMNIDGGEDEGVLGFIAEELAAAGVTGESAKGGSDYEDGVVEVVIDEDGEEWFVFRDEEEGQEFVRKAEEAIQQTPLAKEALGLVQAAFAEAGGEVEVGVEVNREEQQQQEKGGNGGAKGKMGKEEWGKGWQERGREVVDDFSSKSSRSNSGRGSTGGSSSTETTDTSQNHKSSRPATKATPSNSGNEKSSNQNNEKDADTTSNDATSTQEQSQSSAEILRDFFTNRNSYLGLTEETSIGPRDAALLVWAAGVSGYRCPGLVSAAVKAYADTWDSHLSPWELARVFGALAEMGAVPEEFVRRVSKRALRGWTRARWALGL